MPRYRVTYAGQAGSTDHPVQPTEEEAIETYGLCSDDVIAPHAAAAIQVLNELHTCESEENEVYFTTKFTEGPTQKLRVTEGDTVVLA